MNAIFAQGLLYRLLSFVYYTQKVVERRATKSWYTKYVYRLFSGVSENRMTAKVKLGLVFDAQITENMITNRIIRHKIYNKSSIANLGERGSHHDGEL